MYWIRTSGIICDHEDMNLNYIKKARVSWGSYPIAGNLPSAMIDLIYTPLALIYNPCLLHIPVGVGYTELRSRNRIIYSCTRQ